MSNRGQASEIPLRNEWEDYLGEYHVVRAGGSYRANVFLRNRDLYVRYNIPAGLPGMRLRPYRPGIFYTAAGTQVVFQHEKMQFGAIDTVKVS